METLEDLKAIIAGKPGGSTHCQIIDGDAEYFEMNGYGIYHCSTNEKLYSENICNIRLLSDIELIIELKKELVALKGIDDKCKHQSTEARYAYVECNTCSSIKTDGGWGVASRMWFENLEQARFYERNGFLPK